MSQIVILRADERHDEALAALRWVWRVEEAGEDGGSRETFVSTFRIWLHDHRESHHGCLALYEEQPVGIAWPAITDRIPDPRRVERRSGHVQSVFVRESHRNRSIGSVMLRELIVDARAMELDYLVLHPTINSVPLYRRHGFAVSDGLMELRLDR
jgi:ribosomal protein S18 acetylase RimI-like enzyme